MPCRLLRLDTKRQEWRGDGHSPMLQPMALHSSEPILSSGWLRKRLHQLLLCAGKTQISTVPTLSLHFEISPEKQDRYIRFSRQLGRTRHHR